MARRARRIRALSGVSEHVAQTPGGSRLARVEGFRRARRRPRGCARTSCSRCRRRQAARSKEALPPTQLLARVTPGEGAGVTGERGPGLRMLIARTRHLPHRSTRRSKPPTAKLRVEGGAEGDEEPITGPQGVSSTTRRRPGETRGPRERVTGRAIAPREGGPRAARPSSMEGTPDRGTSLLFHEGAVEAVSAAPPNRSARPRKARPGIERKSRQGCHRHGLTPS